MYGQECIATCEGLAWDISETKNIETIGPGTPGKPTPLLIYDGMSPTSTNFISGSIFHVEIGLLLSRDGDR